MEHLNGGREEKALEIWRALLLALPAVAWRTASGRARDLSSSGRLHLSRQNLDWNESAAGFVRAELEEQLRRNQQQNRLEKENQEPFLGKDDQETLEHIKRTVKRDNRNNLTRTAAYLELYQAYPELHWAFLAHMVSRNAGWNMSDLKGGQADLLLGDEATYRNYRFLERSNALIFQDAYPQLLLYACSKRLGKSLFHLLPYFHVSRFMQPFWDYFWLSRSSSLLAVGLIINEQNYIEKRVIRHRYFQQNVLRKAPYVLGSLSGINQVVFPFSSDGDRETGQPRLGGRVISHFASLTARVRLGRHLYALLFGLPQVRRGAEQFAFSTSHTGSRADYWPALFSSEADLAITTPMQSMELTRTRSPKYNHPIYSPPLLACYEDTPYEPITREDWFQNGEPLGDISMPSLPLICEITAGHQSDILMRAAAHDAAAGKRRWDTSQTH